MEFERVEWPYLLEKFKGVEGNKVRACWILRKLPVLSRPASLSNPLIITQWEILYLGFRLAKILRCRTEF